MTSRPCQHPGCHARVLASGPHDCCARHRPKPTEPHRQWTPEQRAAKRERDRKARAVSGLPSGWEDVG